MHIQYTYTEKTRTVDTRARLLIYTYIIPILRQQPLTTTLLLRDSRKAFCTPWQTRANVSAQAHWHTYTLTLYILIGIHTLDILCRNPTVSQNVRALTPSP